MMIGDTKVENNFLSCVDFYSYYVSHHTPAELFEREPTL